MWDVIRDVVGVDRRGNALEEVWGFRDMSGLRLSMYSLCSDRGSEFSQ